MVVLEICFRTVFKKSLQFCYFAGARKSKYGNLLKEIDKLDSCVIRMANNDAPSFRKILERLSMPVPYFHQNILVF